jgi:hypothetical protein
VFLTGRLCVGRWLPTLPPEIFQNVSISAFSKINPSITGPFKEVSRSQRSRFPYYRIYFPPASGRQTGRLGTSFVRPASVEQRIGNERDLGSRIGEFSKLTLRHRRQAHYFCPCPHWKISALIRFDGSLWESPRGGCCHHRG